MLMGNHEAASLVALSDIVHRYGSNDVQHEYGGNYDKRNAAYAPDGEIGRLLAHNPIVYIHQTPGRMRYVFSHADITPTFAAMFAGSAYDRPHAATKELQATIDAALALSRAVNNGQHENALQKDPILVYDTIIGQSGPLWSREVSRSIQGGYFYPTASGRTSVCDMLTESLHALGATRMVVAHSAQASNRMQPSPDGRYINIDLAMSHHMEGYAGRASDKTWHPRVGVLEIREERVWALYDEDAAPNEILLTGQSCHPAGMNVMS